MLNKNQHRLLKRQIAKAGFDDADIEKFKDFFNAVDDAYKGYDEDIKYTEIILEESSKELYKANQSLKSEVDRAESEINIIVDTIEGVIFKTDLSGNFKYLNKACKDLLGISAEEAINKNYREFLVGINKDENLRLQNFFSEHHDDFVTLLKFFKSTGEKVWVQVRLVLTYDNDGIANGTIGTMTDVTQLKETEIELNHANKTKDEFLSTMSHEIRTPLNAVIGMSDILLMEKFLPEQLENLQVLKYSSEHLLALINDLLNLNKFKSNEVKLVETDFNLSELIQNIQLHFKHTAINNNLSFETILDSSIPAVLKGDSLKLSQVLKNLLSNAFKFTHEGGIVFKIELLNINKEATSIRFSVKDSGIGVSYDKQKDIFKSFVQASANTSQLYGGSGLGLYISKELLSIQATSLQLESKEGEGSYFWFDITLKNSDNVNVLKQSQIAKTNPIALNVLVAEDNNINALVLKKLFNKWEINYEIAKNGQELLDIYHHKDFDLILMDLQMPILNGYDTARVIRKMVDIGKSTIPIIALTAFSKSEVQDKTKRYKMNGYLSKPFNVNELHELLSFYSVKKQEVG
ncbi:PAS domain-containing hybrid sensor histidine kinase/response regulator [Winogradskyella psychrotolerans]|uniref:PAS domain-containing hybrid sensor histidine kinase/response regulator n=1 Tax=Winogradskyella psychrotolerans TaxID=1344585 RepID=UPI001C06F530|nr:response regulator [Winogradskyella psychrotolerans]MBU2928477.1 response regulator [Winogradskyella psychrotolerans]